MIATLAEITGALILIAFAVAGGVWVWDTLVEEWKRR